MMGIYDNREEPAYQFDAPPRYAKNSYVLKWWTAAHDDAIAGQIATWQWYWPWHVVDALLNITPRSDIDTWKQQDPLCSQFADYNVLMYFAVSRARALHLTDAIRLAQWKVCPLCGLKFIENSLPMPFVERLGMDQLDFCSPCLKRALLDSGSDVLSEEEILAYLRDLATAMQQIPPQSFGRGRDDLCGFDPGERLAVLRVLGRKPTLGRVKELYGSWLAALVKSGILEDGTRRTARGTHCIARDGHICLSLGEKTIDDFLYQHGVAHEKEPRYPEGNFRADFVVAGAFVEYLGLAGNEAYDSKTLVKQEICHRHGIRFVPIYAADLAGQRKLETKLLKYAQEG